MKKILSLLLSLILCTSLYACGGQNDTGSSTEDTNVTNKINKTIDDVASELGLTGGTETFYSMIGATAGKEYNNGDVELYQFDENSDAYKKLINGESYLTASAYKDGIVLLFSLGTEVDTELVDKFNALNFK